MTTGVSDYLQTDHLKGDLAERSVRGGMVSITAHACSFSIRMGSTMILARILSPGDYGLVGMVTAITGLVSLFKDLGLSAATVQSNDLNHNQVSALFWINSGFGVLFAVLMLALAPGIAWFYGEERLAPICAFLGGGFVFSGLATQQLAVLRRQMRFGTLARIEIASTACGVGLAIGAASLGGRYWSLVIMLLAFEVGTATGAWIASGWRPRAVVRVPHTGHLLRFGANLSGFNILNYFVKNMDSVLIGKYLGSRILGLYSKAYQLLLLPIQLINYPIGQVAIPALSRLRNDDQRYREYYCGALKTITLVSFPIVAILAADSREIIALVLGNQWLEAAPIFQVLALACFPQQIMGTTGWIYVSRGQASRMLKFSGMTTPLLLLSFVLALKWGAKGVAAAYVLWSGVMFVPAMWYATRFSPVGLRDITRAVGVPAVCGMLVYAGMIGGRQLIVPEGDIKSLLSTILTGFILCAAGIGLWPRGRSEIVRLARYVVSLHLEWWMPWRRSGCGKSA